MHSPLSDLLQPVELEMHNVLLECLDHFIALLLARHSVMCQRMWLHLLLAGKWPNMSFMHYQLQHLWFNFGVHNLQDQFSALGWHVIILINWIVGVWASVCLATINLVRVVLNVLRVALNVRLPLAIASLVQGRQPSSTITNVWIHAQLPSIKRIINA